MRLRIRMANPGVTLGILVGAFRAGATAEEIAQDYSSLKLDDIYAVIAYCLRHEPEVESYLSRKKGISQSSPRPERGAVAQPGFAPAPLGPREAALDRLNAAFRGRRKPRHGSPHVTRRVECG